MQSKITPRAGGYNFQLKCYWTGTPNPQDIRDAVQAKIEQLKAEKLAYPERTGYDYSIMVLQGNLPPIRC